MALFVFATAYLARLGYHQNLNKKVAQMFGFFVIALENITLLI